MRARSAIGSRRPTSTDVITDGNGTAIDMTQSVGQATDFHDEKVRQADLYRPDADLNLDWKLSDRVSLNLDSWPSPRARELSEWGYLESELALLGYSQRSDHQLPFRWRSILPYTAGLHRSDERPERRRSGWHASQLYEHVMLYREGYGVTDSIGQFRADLDIKGDDPKQGLIDFRIGSCYSHDSKDTALYSNDGGTGNQTSGYNIPSPAGFPIGVFNDGGILSGLSGANRLPTQWLTFDGPVVFNAITQQQQAILGPGFTFAPPKVSDSRVVQERVFSGYLEATFGWQPARPAFLHWRTGCSSRRYTQETVNGLATAFTKLTPRCSTTPHNTAYNRRDTTHAIELESAIPMCYPRCRSGGN